MAYHVMRCALATVLLTAYATRASPIEEHSATSVDTAVNPEPMFLAVNANYFMKLFVDTLRQTHALFERNSEDLRDLRKLPDQVAALRDEISGLKSSVKDNCSKESGSTKEDIVITNQLESLVKEVAELKNEIRGLKGSIKDNSSKVPVDTQQDIFVRNLLMYLRKESSDREKELKETLETLAEQLNIKKWVYDYDLTKDWRELRKNLEDELDHSSLAYAQLQKVPWNEVYAPWQIGFDGHMELVTVLVFLGRGINMTDSSKDNMLHGAVAGGQVRLVEMLLDNGAGIESRNGWGNAPLALACKYRKLEVARLLVKRGADLDGVNYDERWAGLARAADNGDLEIVKFMVEAGASTTIKDRNGDTPLEVARRKGNKKVVEYLSKFPH